MQHPWVRVMFLLAAVAAAVAVVASDRARFLETTRSLGAPAIVAAGLGAAVNVLAAGAAWLTILPGTDTDAGTGSRLPVGAGLRIFLVGQLGKFLPGSVWNVVAQAELASDRGVPRASAAAASVVGLVLTLCTAVLLAVPAALTLDELGRWRWAAPLALPLLAVLLDPWPLERARALLVRLSGRPAGGRRLSRGRLLRADAWTLVSWAGLGAQASVLLVAAGAPVDPRTVLLAVSGYALAWVAGFVVVVTPAGAGVRELVLVLLWAPLLGTIEALAVVLVARVVTVLVDLGLAAAAMAVGRRALR